MEAADEKKLKNIDLSSYEILYQDESQYNWSLKGKMALFKGYRYRTRINCFGTFGIKKSKLILTQENRGNSETMVKHLKVVRASYLEDKKLIIFTDNASWHKTKIVKEYCEDNNIKLWFTPPYAPEFNPIERVWSFMKSIVKKRYLLQLKCLKCLCQNYSIRYKMTIKNS